jgi:hypothetical protein
MWEGLFDYKTGRYIKAIVKIWFFKILWLICSLSSHTYWNVIKKGRGIRPNEALATLRFIEEGAAFYHAKRGKITTGIKLV